MDCGLAKADLSDCLCVGFERPYAMTPLKLVFSKFNVINKKELKSGIRPIYMESL